MAESGMSVQFDPMMTLPAPERAQHNAVERVERISDDQGRISRPYRVIDILEALERRGAISQAQRDAGEIFRRHFNTACLDPLQAADVSRPVVSGRTKSPILAAKIEGARESVWLAISSVGGMTSVGGSCLWHVIGWQCSVREWRNERWLGKKPHPSEATGVLIAVLGILEKHYDL